MLVDDLSWQAKRISLAEILSRWFVEDHLGVRRDTGCNCLENYRGQPEGETWTVTLSGDMSDRPVLDRRPDLALCNTISMKGFKFD